MCSTLMLTMCTVQVLCIEAAKLATTAEKCTEEAQAKEKELDVVCRGAQESSDALRDLAVRIREAEYALTQILQKNAEVSIVSVS